jgi:hypothetical protein
MIRLPFRLNGQKLRQVVRDFVYGCASSFPTEMQIDFSQLGFIEPAGVTFLDNFMLWLRHHGVRVMCVGCNTQKEAIRFLDDSQFFVRHCGRKLLSTAAPRRSTRPVIDVHHERSHAWIRSDLVPWLAALLNVSTVSLSPFQVCVSEIFNNIKDHSSLEIGTIFAQHFPKLNRIGIAAADFGAGIPTRVREVYPTLVDDNNAIIQAVQDGFTTRSSPRNRGAGLDYLLETIVAENGGTVTIYSLTGAVLFWKNETGIVAQPLAEIGFCPGTTIDIQLKTDTIRDLGGDPEDFTW